MDRIAAPAALFVVVVIAGCSSASGGVPGGPDYSHVAASSTMPSSCRVRGPLPDPVCTPGARDPAVTQANIHRTICVPGYTRGVRPPLSYTEPLKLLQMKSYRYYGGRSARRYEEDHLIPLELGGAPRDPRNLWPESHAQPDGSFTKDATENYLHREVCDGRESLAKAQHDIATDWVTASAGAN